MPSQISFQVNLICVLFSSHFFLFEARSTVGIFAFQSREFLSAIMELQNSMLAMRQEVNTLKAQLQMNQAPLASSGSGI